MRLRAPFAGNAARDTLAAWQSGGIAYLQELDDVSFFGAWAAVRTLVALAPAGTPSHAEIKSLYDAVVAEYRSRLDGA
jgi:hypothetical protein